MHLSGQLINYLLLAALFFSWKTTALVVKQAEWRLVQTKMNVFLAVFFFFF